jgi:hypothetical protein
MLALNDPIPDVAGAVCEALFVQSHYYRGRLAHEASVVLLRADSAWHRFFIDSDVVFWQLVNGPDSAGDFDRHHYALSDLGSAHGFIGRRLLGVTTLDRPSGGELHVLFDGAPALVYRSTGDGSHITVGELGAEVS